jgi:membrane-associated phospholipid phosphatase
MLVFIKANNKFIILFGILFTAGIILHFFYSKIEIHLLFNSVHNHIFDIFFRYITFLGDGVFVIGSVLLLLFFKFRYALSVLLSYVASGILVQLMKNVIFPHSPRPYKVFEHYAGFHFINNFHYYHHHSFPSGHSASIFGLMLILSTIFNNRINQYICFAIALIVAFSRVYLSQHFFLDILVGSLIGMLSGLFAWFCLSPDKLKNNWMGFSIFAFFKQYL